MRALAPECWDIPLGEPFMRPVGVPQFRGINPHCHSERSEGLSQGNQNWKLLGNKTGFLLFLYVKPLLGCLPAPPDINLHRFYFSKETLMQNIENMRWTSACWAAKVNVLASEAHSHPLHAPGENWRNETMGCVHKGFVFVLTCLMLVSSASAQVPVVPGLRSKMLVTIVEDDKTLGEH